MEIGKRIIEIAIINGANIAGIASTRALRTSPSHLIYKQLDHYSGVGTINDDDKLTINQMLDWPKTARSLLVIGLSHPRDLPTLDWWDGKGTPGNRILMDIIRHTQDRIERDLNINTRKLHYYVEKGGVFLKDAAVLAGLGCIGKNNMLVTRDYGPRVRLRALFLDAEIDPTGPVAFDPCADCKAPCRKVCPEKAMVEKVVAFDSIEDSLDLPARDGAYDRTLCNIRMEKDISESYEYAGGQTPIQYCRKCEFVCPAGK